MRAFIAASAIDDPVTPLIKVESAIEVCASPPCMRPVSTVASLRRLCEMPELLRKFPARINSGTASSAKFCVSVTVSWIGMVSGNSGCCRKNNVPEMPIANANGIPISIRIGEGDENDQHDCTLEHIDGVAFFVLAAQFAS